MFIAVFTWLKERWRDALMWPVNLLRDWPQRVARIGLLSGADAAVIAILPGETPGAGRAVRVHSMLTCLFDLLGGPEIAQYWMHLFMTTSALQPHEIDAISSVLGPRAIRYRDVRIAEGGILPLIFRFNGRRAFCTWHTIHLPRKGPHTRASLPLLVHEAVHVFQYERLGSIYIGKALYAQRRLGRGAYDYGGVEGLRQAQEGGVPFAAFNPEAQAQVAQDYYMRRQAGDYVEPYERFVAALRAGWI